MEIKQKTGELSGCPNCNGQPHFYLNTGKQEYHSECSPCRIRLWPRATMQEAVEIWESLPRQQETTT